MLFISEILPDEDLQKPQLYILWFHHKKEQDVTEITKNVWVKHRSSFIPRN
jgi:hypothetical protein